MARALLSLELFEEALTLARKLSKLFSLCNDLLQAPDGSGSGGKDEGKGRHAFGLMRLKAVIRLAGYFKRDALGNLDLVCRPPKSTMRQFPCLPSRILLIHNRMPVY